MVDYVVYTPHKTQTCARLTNYGYYRYKPGHTESTYSTAVAGVLWLEEGTAGEAARQRCSSGAVAAQQRTCWCQVKADDGGPTEVARQWDGCGIALQGTNKYVMAAGQGHLGGRCGGTIQHW